MSSPYITATIWAGVDIFATASLRIPQQAHISMRMALYNQVIDQFQRQVVEDFGAGATIQQVDDTTYVIDVRQVQFQRQMSHEERTNGTT